jgi:hypothetical protein
MECRLRVLQHLELQRFVRFVAPLTQCLNPMQLVLAFVREKRLHVAAPQRKATANADGQAREHGHVAGTTSTCPDDDTSESDDVLPDSHGGGDASWFHGREVHQVEFVPSAPSASPPCRGSSELPSHGDGMEQVGGGAAWARAEEARLMTASEDGTLKILSVRPCRLLTSVGHGRAGSMPDHSSGDEGADLVSRETIQGDKKEQLGAALRCLAKVETRSHGLVTVAGGGECLLLRCRHVRRAWPHGRAEVLPARAPSGHLLQGWALDLCLAVLAWVRALYS